MTTAARFAAITPPRPAITSWTLPATLRVATAISATRAATLGAATRVITPVDGFDLGVAASQSLVLTVNEIPVISAPSGTALVFVENVAVDLAITTTGYPAAIFTHGGTLPAGLSWVDPESSDNLIHLTGTPANASSGDYTVTLTATNAVGAQTITLNLQVWPTDQGPALRAYLFIDGATSQPLMVNTPTLLVSGPNPRVKVGAPGASDLYLGGPTVTETTGYKVRIGTAVTVNLQAGEALYGVLPAGSGPPPDPVAPTFTSDNSLAGNAGTFLSATIVTTATPVAVLTTSTRPGWLAFLDNGDGTGVLSGTPPVAAVTTITVHATNLAGTTNQTFVITATSVGSNSPPAITSASFTRATVGANFAFTVTTTGFPTPTSAVISGTLPPGVTFTDLGNGTARAAGVPTTVATYAIVVRATNSQGTVDQTLTIAVGPASVVTPTYCPVVPNPAVNQTLALETWINAQANGSVLDFNSLTGATYRCDGYWVGASRTAAGASRSIRVLNKTALTLQNFSIYTDFEDPDSAYSAGAARAAITAVPTTWPFGNNGLRTRGMLRMQGCTDCHLDNITMRGPGQRLDGSALYPGQAFGYRPELEAQHGLDWLSCIRCTDHNCTATYNEGDGWIAEGTGNSNPSQYINWDAVTNVPIPNNFHSEWSGRQGVTTSNARSIHYDGYIGGAQHSAIDCEPEDTGSISQHIDLGPLVIGWHTNNMLNMAGGGDNLDTRFHDVTLDSTGRWPPPGRTSPTLSDGTIASNSGLGYPTPHVTPNRQGPLSATNLPTFTHPLGHPSFGGVAGIGAASHTDGVIFHGYHVAGEVGRNMCALALSDCTALDLSDLRCSNGFDLAWLTGTATQVTVTNAQRTAGVVTLTVGTHHLVGGVPVRVKTSDLRFNASPVTITAVTPTTITYNLAGTDIASTVVTGYTDGGTFTGYSQGWTQPVGATVYDGFNQCSSGSTTRLWQTDSRQWWDVLGTHTFPGLTARGTAYQAAPSSAISTNTACVVDAQAADGHVRVTSAVVGVGGPAFRFVDETSGWWFDFATGRLIKRDGAVDTVMATYGAGSAGQQVHITLAGNVITVVRAGVTLGVTTDAYNATATLHGIYLSTGTIEFDNFSFTP